MHSDILTTTPMRPAETNSPPVFRVPSHACDAHFHVFEQGFPSVAKPHYTFPEARLEQYLELARLLGISRMVLVQPSFYGTDNSLTLQVLEKLGASARAVVMIEESITDFELDRYDALGVRAVRLDLFARSSWPIDNIVAYIRRMLERTRPRGWHIQFYAPGYVVRDLIPFFAELDDDFVIDHMGYMLEEDGLTAHDFARLLDVMKNGRCWLKLSGPYRIAKKRGYEAVAPIAQAILATRPDRAIWGSDWPHLPDGSRDTGELFNLLALWAPDAAVRNQVLVENPARLFDFVDSSVVGNA